MAALTARPVFCELKSQKVPVQKTDQPPVAAQQVQKLRGGAELTTQTAAAGGGGSEKIVLQPRLCTLRSYGSDPAGVMIKSPKNNMDLEDEVSPFFAALSDYIESSKKSQDFEIISGRLAMIVFAATVTEEIVTGNSLFRKMDVQGIAEAAGACLAAVTCAAIFAWFSSARNKVGPIFSGSCNTFIDTLIDQIVDGLFYDTDLSDWSDDV